MPPNEAYDVRQDMALDGRNILFYLIHSDSGNMNMSTYPAITLFLHLNGLTVLSPAGHLGFSDRL